LLSVIGSIMGLVAPSSLYGKETSFLADAAAAGLLDIVGGCCGTTPATIARIAEAVAGRPARMAGFRE